MRKAILSALASGLLVAGSSFAISAQDTPTTTTTTTTTVRQATQNPDGSWTVVEYPTGKEISVNFSPTTLIPGATGHATIIRNADNTTIHLDVSGINKDTSNLNLYAVDPLGTATLLGPVALDNGTATFSTTTPLNKFMLGLSPDANLTTIGPDAHVALMSGIPEGLSVIPLARRGEGPHSPVGEKVSATAANSYSVPMLNVPSLPRHKESEVKVNFANTDAFKRATFFVTPDFNKSGATRVKAKFHELSDVPNGSFLTLWAVGADGSFTRLGSTTNSGTPNVATIDTDTNKTNVRMSDFGLFLTVEPNETITAPTGPVVIRVTK
jgi:hypothetical protein